MYIMCTCMYITCTCVYIMCTLYVHVCNYMYTVCTLIQSSKTTFSDSNNSSIFNTSPRAKRRKRKRRSSSDSKLTKNQKSQLVKSLVTFKNDRQFTDYKIIVDGHPVRSLKLQIEIEKIFSQSTFIN